MKTLFYLLLLSLGHMTYAQNINSEKYDVEITNSYLSNTSTNDIEQLLENTASIQLVSLLPVQWKDTLNEDIVLDVFSFVSIRKEDSHLDTTRIKNRATIAHRDVEWLLSTLCPTTTDSYPVICYMPRQGIRFLDRYGTLLAFVEISFECAGYEATGIPLNTQISTNNFKALHIIFDRYMGKAMHHYDIN